MELGIYFEINKSFTSVKKHLKNYSKPIFITGASGMGKTRLIHEITKWSLEHNPKDLIIDFKRESEINYFKKQSASFYDKLLDHQILIIDNLRFFTSIVTKEKAIHFINEAINNNLKIILASSSIVKLELFSAIFISYLQIKLTAPPKHILVQHIRDVWKDDSYIHQNEIIEWLTLNVHEKMSFQLADNLYLGIKACHLFPEPIEEFNPQLAIEACIKIKIRL